ncbi:MAG: MmcQ/YjbR family DNA-binding protein [Flavobacteriales bacterium]|jgi:predicted DNA-binding protein (MmcQ/YjbR family)|tara:strand:+ start:18136 stop:18492 length:357 start_codon:yes stop_codon:yes gene_type:complete
MPIENLRSYCLAKATVAESFPFDEHTLVVKVAGKMFALFSLEKHPLQVNLKCDPEKAIDLRERYQSVIPGYHMNKKHWNTLVIDGELSKELVEELVDHSYELVVSKLSKKVKSEFLLD